MGDLKQSVIDMFRNLNFEIHSTSFCDITSTDELTPLQECITSIDSDSAKIVRWFPDLFVFHRSQAPKAGAFFIVLMPNGIEMPIEVRSFYRKYFPEDLLIVSDAPSSRLKGQWINSSDPVKPLQDLIQRRLGA